jgi:hypothetical protein
MMVSGLAGTGENRYINGNLWFSYDRVLRVGPPGPALFYYLIELFYLNEPAGCDGGFEQPGRIALYAPDLNKSQQAKQDSL